MPGIIFKPLIRRQILRIRFTNPILVKKIQRYQPKIEPY